jgi:cytochrome b pre-mRNA-processing protein 3
MTFTLKSLFRGGKDGTGVSAVYSAIVEQARKPAFYNLAGVPDTPTGRFAMVALHGFLAMDRLGREADARRFSQDLFDLMFADLDRNLREMGVGEHSVGKKVKGFAQYFFAMAATFREGMTQGGDALSAPLRQYVYRDCEPTADALVAMTAYLQASEAHLAAQKVSDIGMGKITFTPPPGEE